MATPKNQRICIVGAGAAGLSAAHYLRAKGYQNVEVLEASDRAGGKCCSFYHNGQPIDVGAIFVAHGYANVLRLAEYYGVPLVNGPRHKIYYSHNGKYRNLVPEIDELLNPAMLVSSLRWVKQFVRCRRLARAGFLGMPKNADLPISEFYPRHGVSRFERLSVPLFSSYGYGYPDTEATAYQMKLNLLGIPGDIETLLRGLRMAKKRQPNGDRGKYLTWWRVGGGYESLFQTMAHRLSVRLNTPAKDIHRENGHVTVTCGAEQRTYDKVIFTIDPIALAELLGPRDPVAKLMAKTEAIDYHSLVCEVENTATRAVRIFADNLTPDRRGHLTTYCQPEPPDNICVAYAIGGPGISNDDIEENIARDFASVDARFLRVLQHNKWRYAPNVPPDLMPTFFPAVEGRQGVDNLYFGGEIMSCGTVETVCEYSRSLVERFF